MVLTVRIYREHIVNVKTITLEVCCGQTRQDQLKFLTEQHVLLWFAKEH